MELFPRATRGRLFCREIRYGALGGIEMMIFRSATGIMMKTMCGVWLMDGEMLRI